MKKYQVYGIGNALVDIDFEVSNATLERLNIEKGVMTLIDEDKHHRLLEELDGIKHLKECGGSAGNTLVTLQQLGARTFFSCKVGNDSSGKFYYNTLTSQGVDSNLTDALYPGTTGKCIVLVTPDADRTMNTHLGITAEFSKAEISESALKNSEYLYIEGFLVASPPSCEAAIIAREMAQKFHVKTAICLSDPNMVLYFKDKLHSIIGNQVDIIFSNKQEAMLFTQTSTLEEAKQALKQYARQFVITLGANGSLTYDGYKFSHIAAYPTEVLDTVGAGDIFAGTFLYAITQGHSFETAGKLANFAASKVVSKFGPRLDHIEIMEIQNSGIISITMNNNSAYNTLSE